MRNDQAIFLDFSNTITTVESENKSIDHWLDLLKKKYALNDNFHEKFRETRLKKLIDREVRFRTFMEVNEEVLLELYGISEILEEDYYVSHERNLRLRPDFLEFIEPIHASFFIVMVTDADNVYTERTLNALGITSYFDRIVTAENVRFPKPNPKIFNEALRESDYPSKVIFIGDSERRDIEGAKGMRFLAIKMADNSNPTLADERVHNFQEIAGLLKAWNLM